MQSCVTVKLGIQHDALVIYTLLHNVNYTIFLLFYYSNLMLTTDLLCEIYFLLRFLFVFMFQYLLLIRLYYSLNTYSFSLF